MRIRLTEVAELAGVGLATVDRVLNERGGVAPSTAKKVVEAARLLGWARDLPSVYRTGVRFEVFLRYRELPLFAGLNQAFERLIPSVGRGVIIQRTFLDDTRPEVLARAIRRTKSNAIIIHGQDEPVIIDAVSEVAAGGVPSVTMISDLPTSPRLAYVGIDHFRAGRCAAFLLSRMARTADFVVLCHSSEFRAHSERISGFQEGVRDYCHASASVRLIGGCDDEASTRSGLAAALRELPDIAGIYNSGAANTIIESTLRALRISDVTFVGHDFAGDAFPMLDAGIMAAAVGERIDRQARQAVDVLLHRFGFVEQKPEREMTPFNILVRDNFY